MYIIYWNKSKHLPHRVKRPVSVFRYWFSFVLDSGFNTLSAVYFWCPRESLIWLVFNWEEKKQHLISCAWPNEMKVENVGTIIKDNKIYPLLELKYADSSPLLPSNILNVNFSENFVRCILKQGLFLLKIYETIW